MRHRQRPHSQDYMSQHSRRPGSEDPLQAYLRQLHEAGERRNGEPVRRKDPWAGLVL